MSLIALHYKLKEKIGSGSFGTVYTVEDIANKQILAIKIFDKIPLDDIREKLNPQTMQEIIKISHPNLIKVMDYGIHQNHLYFLSEFYKGQGLQNFRLNKKNKGEFLKIIVQICYAIDYLHSCNIIHKDLKLENILYRQFEKEIKVKVCDFGFNKIISRTDAYAEGEVVSLPYLSPELLQGAQFSAKSDLYALGIIMYYLAVGNFPFSEDEIELMSEKKALNIIPQFPSKINPAVDKKLEELIFHLIEFNPEIRISSPSEVIDYINKSQKEQFPRSLEPSILKQIESKLIKFRENDIMKLKSFVERISHGQGQIVFLTGEKGIGKKESMRFLKWYSLSEDNYVFCYNCSKDHRDPFFMLIKEVLLSQNEESKLTFKKNASEKFCEFLFESEEKSLEIFENKSSLEKDFVLGRDYIYNFSKVKPIIYFISDIDMAGESTLDFIKFISQDIDNYRILILASTYNKSIIEEVENSVQTHILPLSKTETYKFLNELLLTDCPEDFLKQIYYISNGNQLFIKSILVSLIENNQIITQNGEWEFNVDITKIELPSTIKNLIDIKISQIPTNIKNLLSKLTVLQVPLSTEIIKYILDFKTSKELFFFMQQCEDMEILVKNEDYEDEGYYKFVYPKIKDILSANILPKQRKAIALKVIHYFKDKKVTKPVTVDGLISHCLFVKDYESSVEYKMAKAGYYIDKKNYLKAWDSCYDSVKYLDKIKEKISNDNIKKYLKMFFRLSNILGKCNLPQDYFRNYQKYIKPDFEIFLLYSKQLLQCHKYSDSVRILQRAEKFATQIEKYSILISLLELYTLSNKLDKSAELLKKINPDFLSTKQKVEFLLQKANFYYVSAQYESAIETLKLGARIAQKESLYFLLGRVYQVLADTYNIENIVDKAIHFYQEASTYSKGGGDLLNLARIFSHLGFLYYKKGELQNAKEKLKQALYHFQMINYLPGMAEVNLNLAQIQHKLGEFHKSDKYFHSALKISKNIRDGKLQKKILNKYAFLKFRISLPSVFLRFLHKNYPEYFKDGKIVQINSFLKNYVFFLILIGKEEYIKTIFKQIEAQKVNINLEKEFILQMSGWIARSKGHFIEAIKFFKKAATVAHKNKNEYALMNSHFNLSDTYYLAGNLKQAAINCDIAKSIATKNDFARWRNYARVLQSKILLKNPEINLRTIIRELLYAEEVSRKMNDWSMHCESLLFIMLIYHSLHNKKLEESYKMKFVALIEKFTRGLDEDDQQSLKNKFHFYILKSAEKIKEIVAYRANISPTKLQYYFFDLLQLSSVQQIKFYIGKHIKEMIGINRYAILLYGDKKGEEDFWLSSGFHKGFLTGEHQPYFEKVRINMKPEYYNIEKKNYCLLPLMLKDEIIGMVILSDNGEFPFTKSEKLIIKLSGLYLTIILKKIGEYEEVLEQREQLSNLFSISRDLLQIMDLDALKRQITLNAIGLSGGERGFFITLDENENFVFDVAIMKSGEKIDEKNLKISKTILREVYESNIARTITDAFQEASFSDADSIKLYELHSVYCSPIIVNNSTFGFLYLDNIGSKQKIIKFNEKLLKIFLLASETSIKNSLDYEKLCIANQELLKIEQERAQFINISAHEFNTPIQTLKGYFDILKDENIQPEVKSNTLRVMENNINRLLNSINNVMQMNAVERSSLKLVKEIINIKDILNIVYDEIKILSDTRKQKLLLQISKNLKPVYAERNCLINAIKNLVLNAIKFTDDYGEIIIGARKSEFKKEEIDNNETIVIYIKDNGIGIPSYELENIFQEFYEVANIESHHSGLTEFKSSGLGLGLPVTKSIIELFGGKMWVKSVKGEGSTFFLALPVGNKKTDLRE